MQKYFSKKATVTLIGFFLCHVFINAEKQTFSCASPILQSLCDNQRENKVCGVTVDNQGITYKSPCQACKNLDTLTYSYGPCSCQKVKCQSGQKCTSGVCTKIESSGTERLREIAHKYLSEQKYLEALQVIQKGIKTNEQDPYLFYLGALASFGNDQPKESLKFIKRAIALNPEIPEFYVIRGRAFSQNSQFQQSNKQFKRAQQLGFDDLGLLAFYEAQSLLKNQKNQESIKKFQYAIKQHPERTEWYVRKALAHLINKQYKMALLTCREGLKIDPNNQQIRLFMKQFENIDEEKEKNLEKIQEENLKTGNFQNPDPELINKYITQKREEQIMKFEKQRMEQKKSKEDKEQAFKKNLPKESQL